MTEIYLEDDIKELYELTAKVGRRCMYDLKHCVDFLPDNLQEVYRPRLESFETILEAATGTKDYRHRLHRTIADQEHQITRLTSLLKENGIPLPEDLPI